MSIVAARQGLQAAALAEAAALPAPVQAALSEALSKPSPVDAVIGAYDALRVLSIDLGPKTAAALRAAALLISEQDFHGRAEEAASLAAAMDS